MVARQDHASPCLAPEGAAVVGEFERIVELNVADVLSEVRGLGDVEKRILYEAACYAAAVDHQIHRK